MTRARPSRALRPEFRDLSSREIRAILRRNKVGRIAYAKHNFVEIEPVHYVVDGDWLYVRTSHGTKSRVLTANRWMAFEVDEVEDAFSWRSVLVRGTVYVLEADGPPDLAARYRRALPRLRKIVPRALSRGDPVPFRTVVLGVHIEEATGRAARG